MMPSTLDLLSSFDPPTKPWREVLMPPILQLTKWMGCASPKALAVGGRAVWSRFVFMLFYCPLQSFYCLGDVLAHSWEGALLSRFLILLKCMCVVGRKCIPYVQMTEKAKGGHQIPWS